MRVRLMDDDEFSLRTGSDVQRGAPRLILFRLLGSATIITYRAGQGRIVHNNLLRTVRNFCLLSIENFIWYVGISAMIQLNDFC